VQPRVRSADIRGESRGEQDQKKDAENHGVAMRMSYPSSSA
jgi:hypothetical protein